MSDAPGRNCPLHYRYPTAGFRREPDLHADTLIVAGGLYGNPFALDALLEFAANEPGAMLVFNGDFHWFDTDADVFRRISEVVLAHTAIRGNVETELAAPADDAGCGCGYPDWVGDAEVERSNRILAQLKRTAAADPGLLARLRGLPMHLLAEVGGERVSLVHGDLESLADWDFSQERLRDEPAVAARQLSSAGVRVVASSHTCLPVLAEFDLPHGPVVLANNGAAGMPNFAGTRYGIATRISVRPREHALYAAEVGGLHVEAHALRYDADAWLACFDGWWPQDSAAALSYRRRIVAGPAYTSDLVRRRIAAADAPRRLCNLETS